jgi:hypothetical protein
MVACSISVLIGPKSRAVTFPGLIDFVVTVFFPAVIAMAVAPPEIATTSANVATTFA